LTALADWFRTLPQRYGKRTLIALGAIALLGLAVRAYVVVNPVEHPADDSRAYYALSKALYTEQSFGGPEFRDSSDWSPGAPFLYAAAYYATGGAREGTARIVESLLGIATILVVFALGWRLGGRELGRWVGLFAAFAVAVYPPFIHTTGELMSEPPAMLTLPAAILAFLWASDRSANAGPAAGGQLRSVWPWLVPGLLFGLTALFRPEYLLVAAAFVLLAFIRSSCLIVTPTETKRQLGRGLVGAAVMLIALIMPILPWTIRNVVVLDRVVPISTGGGKALYVGTYLPADGEYQRVKAILAERYLGRDLEPGSEALDEVDPTELFDEVVREVRQEHPDLTRDAALGRAGKDNFSKYFGEDPWGYAGMTTRKVGRMWSSGVGEAMDSTPGRAVQILLVALGLAGFALLGVRRRWWELVVLATPIVLVTAVGAVSLAAPRRNEVLMTLVFPLAGLALSSAIARISSGREWSSPQASSPPN
jgi:4-amino-4-deoxy-L-arabinose transferase-like glycosyltransferase